MNRRTELGKYYEKVLTCLICKKKYGSDFVEEEDRICPTCWMDINKTKRWKEVKGG